MRGHEKVVPAFGSHSSGTCLGRFIEVDITLREVSRITAMIRTFCLVVATVAFFTFLDDFVAAECAFTSCGGSKKITTIKQTILMYCQKFLYTIRNI